jgi:TetR/AcrR family fatty acid metabolism transcriptional regulator
MGLTPRARAGESRLLKRSTILRAAVQVIAERGYFAARMADVATRAQVADGTLYLYFQGKEDLLVSILEEYAEAFLLRARADLAELDDPRDKLARIVERHLVSLERDRPLAKVFQIELRHTRRFLRRVAKGKVAEYLQLLQEVIGEGIERGVFRSDIPVDVAARVVFGSIDECVTAWVLTERPGSLTAQAEPLLKLIMHGLAALQPRGTHSHHDETPRWKSSRTGGKP